MKHQIYLSAFVALLSFAQCASKIVHFTSPKAKLSEYATFGVVNYKKTMDLSSEGMATYSMIEQLVSLQMIRRGYDAAAEPDIMLRYEFIGNQKSEVRSTNTRPFGYTTRFPTYQVTNMLQSTLLVELYDTNTKKLIWQASLDLDKTTNKKNKEQILENAVIKLFNTYLYRARTSSTDESLIIE